MVDKEAIIVAIGADRYKETCLDAWKKAANTGQERNPAAMFDSKVPYEITKLLWGKSGLERMQNDVEKVKLTFQLYTDMPCYELISAISIHYNECSPEAKATFWDHARALLAQEDEALAEPVAYSIWCDYLESPRKIEEAWTELTQDISNTKLIQRLLIASGPVRFRLKEALYDQLISNQEWHYYIYRSLLHSRFDYFGKINTVKARTLLRQLRLSEDTENLARLRQTLETDEEVSENEQSLAKHRKLQRKMKGRE